MCPTPLPDARPTRSNDASWREVLRRLGLGAPDRERFVDLLHQSRAVHAQWRSRGPRRDDIFTAVDEARESGDQDEAVWRAFLANHFGRASQRDDEPDAALAMLRGFGTDPVWTWTNVNADPDAYERWLRTVARRVNALQFGNHRQRYSLPYTSEELWTTVSSFLRAAGGEPRAWIDAGPDARTPQERFDLLYRRFTRIADWGRLAAFDFGELLRDLRLADIEPGKCYLVGSTGPLRAARRIWPGRPPRVLENLAMELAAELGVPPGVLEDALCNWQKRH